ncbi:hypothetical protein ASPZODRAFT_2120726 [Penicilliopsis zonata CBS 506.65]|uniref:Protein kinase domain-containing protein n=1 Tax=Penicilliopsis zonata CBS 506.65 TaxID=1073090 RepID=A0A1L9SP35_9EURO|nr:hypothetical protein ASPZODRAFT_2120726 [Penicilliopsis zonata CBS 506.65]OJJ49012.1 hypothetical protein ASPZODRAFT_2120726 [Penicilliopsis zonata CBS 506.65]
MSQTEQCLYSSSIDAEPLHRYEKGGYHPTALEITKFRSRKGEYVAVKICVSDNENYDGNRELRVLKQMAATSPRCEHIVRLLDDFDLEGANGRHKCLVIELIGPSIPEMITARFHDGRLPGKVAKAIAKQALSGLDALHQQKIAHGALEYGVPEYIVRPASFQTHPPSRLLSALPEIRLVDFGESFSQTHVPPILHTPLALRAPEVIFKDKLDHRVDLWSMGCMLFELFVGQPPFDSFLITPRMLVDQMQEMTSHALPGRWKDLLTTLEGQSSTETPGPGLQQWLDEMYFDGERKADLTREYIRRLGEIIEMLLRFEPSSRASAGEVLHDAWFDASLSTQLSAKESD